MVLKNFSKKMNEPIAHSKKSTNFAFGTEINGLVVMKTPDPRPSLSICCFVQAKIEKGFHICKTVYE